MVSPVLSNVKLLSREQAILEFNRRVLAQAQREDVPLLERLRYICIVSSNLVEFFEVRFADVLEAARTPGIGIGRDEVALATNLAQALVEDQYRVFNDELAPALQAAAARWLELPASACASAHVPA